MILATFFVPGIPQPGGSKRGLLHPKLKRVSDELNRLRKVVK
jgi:hypothetical protein